MSLSPVLHRQGQKRPDDRRLRRDSGRFGLGDNRVEAVLIIGSVGDSADGSISFHHRVFTPDSVTVSFLPGSFGVASTSVHHTVVVRVLWVNLREKKRGKVELSRTRGKAILLHVCTTYSRGKSRVDAVSYGQDEAVTDERFFPSLCREDRNGVIGRALDLWMSGVLKGDF